MIFILLFSQSHLMFAAESDKTHPPLASAELEQNKIQAQLEKVVLGKLEFYARHFPEINFIILDSAADTNRNMQVLIKILGQDPDPLDYEHPEKLRDDLLSVTLERIKYLLQMDAGSSTLFKPGKHALAKRKALCVITMNPWIIAKDDRAATHHLLDIPDSEFNTILPKNYLNHISHLKFVFDHEAYHCLDSYYNGPIPRSQNKLWSGYNILKNELGADAFGSIMNISDHGRVTRYIYTLHNIRALTLLAGDYDHYTYEVVKALLQSDIPGLVKCDIKDRFRISTTIRNRLNGSYDDYVLYRREADAARRIIAGEKEINNFSIKDGEYKKVKILLGDTRRAYKELFGHNITSAK